MTEREWALLSRALKTVGLHKTETIGYIFEDLTWGEYERLKWFVEWLIENNRTVGWGNYREVFAEYVRSKES